MIQSRTKILNMFAVTNSLVMLLSASIALQLIFSARIPDRPRLQANLKDQVKVPVQVDNIKTNLPPVMPIIVDDYDKVKIKTDNNVRLPDIKQDKDKSKIKVLSKIAQVDPIPPPPLAKILLDNFNGSSEINAMGGFGNVFGTGGFCLRSYQQGNSASPVEDGGYMLKLVYNVKNGYAGYYSKLNGIDLSKYQRITFYVKGAKGGEVFEVELGDGKTSYKVDVRDSLPYGASTSWQKVSIPLKAFAEVKNWDKMQGNFAIVFEQYLGIPNNSTLYVDNITFEE